MAKQATTKQSATKQDSEQFDNTDKSGEKSDYLPNLPLQIYFKKHVISA